MMNWLTKLKISMALDERRPLPRRVVRAVERSPEVRRFAENAAKLDKELKNTQPVTEPPAALHASILRAVRSDGSPAESAGEKFFSRLIPISALGLVLLLGVLSGNFLAHRPATGPVTNELPSLGVASSTLDVGGELVQAGPSAVLAPLSDEMLRLNRDLTNAQNYLLASLP
jgi:hypothetical protein